jgi:hypothetical protein
VPPFYAADGAALIPSVERFAQIAISKKSRHGRRQAASSVLSHRLLFKRVCGEYRAPGCSLIRILHLAWPAKFISQAWPVVDLIAQC